MNVFTSYEVKIASSNSGSFVATTIAGSVLTNIADSSRLVDISVSQLREVISDYEAGMTDNELDYVIQVVGLTIECCDDGKVATLQLCAGSWGILIQLLHLEKIPGTLRTLLADDPTFVFVGVGIRDACAKLERDYGLKCKSKIELAPMASRVCRKSHFFDLNLEELAHEMTRINIEKPTIPSLSLWGARDLRNEQIDYAITKAYASYAIGHMLKGGIL